jgi:alkylation response protein AidB-like acyl-CoA dehydrogenase
MADAAKLRDRSMAITLRTLQWVAASEALDRLGIRDGAVKLLRDASRGGAMTATRAGRTFAAAQRLASPARQPRAAGRRRPRLFDLTPDDEQSLLTDTVGGFAIDRRRPAAAAADASCATPPPLLAQANELGLTMIGVPEELGGAVTSRSAATTVLMASALARGDMGIAVACLAPAAVSTAISLWGDADQQSTYLSAFVSDDVPAAALALMEPQPLFDPFALRTRARAGAGGYLLDGVKALVPRGAEAELFVIAADLEGNGPSLFLVEPGTRGLSVAPEPGMGVRAAATARLTLENVTVPLGARLGGDGDSDVYRDCVGLARLAWCAVAVGTGQAVLDYVIEYVNGRVAFGEPVSHRQAVAFTVADMAIELEGMRLVMLRAASRVDQNLPFHREATLARRLVAEHGMRIGSDGVQMLGGHGYTTEHPVERWYRDLRAAGLYEGALLT